MAPKYIFEDDIFFNPELRVGNLEKKALIEDILRPCRLTIEQCEKLRIKLAHELRLGVAQDDGSKFLMFNSFVTKLPTGQETGDFLGLDIGGTNLRIVHLRLAANATTGAIERSTPDIAFYDVPRNIRQSNYSTFFGFLTKCVASFLDQRAELIERNAGNSLPMGFVFSFGTEQTGIASGKVVEMGIHTYLPDIFGKCPLQLFQAELDTVHVPVKIVALANDSTTTLMSGVQLKPDTCAGLILGSGTNIAYIEKVANFKKFKNPPKEAEDVIVVTEFCIYGREGELDEFSTKWDIQLDRESLVPKSYVYEKLVGGAFQGELLRMALVELVKMGFLLNGHVTEQLNTKETIATPEMSAMEAEAARINAGKTDGPNQEVIRVLKNLGYSEDEIHAEDIATVLYTAELFTVRAALFTSIACSVFVDHIATIREGTIRFGCDGSYFKKHPKMQRLVNEFLNALSPQRSSDVFVTEQGSGIGAAVLAACYSK